MTISSWWYFSHKLKTSFLVNGLSDMMQLYKSDPNGVGVQWILLAFVTEMLSQILKLTPAQMEHLQTFMKEHQFEENGISKRIAPAEVKVVEEMLSEEDKSEVVEDEMEAKRRSVHQVLKPHYRREADDENEKIGWIAWFKRFWPFKKRDNEE